MKHTKSGKILVLLLIAALLTISLVGCGNSTDQPTGNNNQPDQASEDKKLSTIYNIDRIVEQGPMKIRIVNVGVVKFSNPQPERKGQIALGLEVGNVGENGVNYFPDKITLRTADGKLLNADIDISEKMGGPYPAKRVIEGFMIFPLDETDPNTIKQLTITLPPVMDTNNKPLGQETTIEVELKKEANAS